MVYIELNGRIGNLLFQIGTAATLAKKNNTEFAVVCHENYLLPEPDNCTVFEYIQQYRHTFFKDITVLRETPADIVPFKQDKNGLYKQIEYCNNIYLSGTFESEKYFDLDLVRNLFQIPAEIKINLLKHYGNILAKGVTSINVRRGNMLNIPHQYNIASLKFFKKAIDYIGKDTDFLFISDDIEWCKKNFKGSNFHFADREPSPMNDLFLQSLCKHNIISNSTFSWWGAWLNKNPDKRVIVPTPWFGKAFSYIKMEDKIPESWMELENRMPLSLRFKAWRLMTFSPIKEKIKELIITLFGKKETVKAV